MSPSLLNEHQCLLRTARVEGAGGRMLFRSAQWFQSMKEGARQTYGRNETDAYSCALCSGTTDERSDL